MKKFNKVLITLCLLLIPFYCINVKADSGWDTDYDSGGWDSGGWDSGGWDSSDWDSGSYDYDDDYDYGSSGSGSNYHYPSYVSTYQIVFLIIQQVFITIIIMTILLKTLDNSHRASRITTTRASSYCDIDENIIRKLLPEYTLQQLKKLVEDKFINVQNAWTEFNYDALKLLCTDELYNTYHSDLEVLKLKNGKNIMTNFNTNRLNIIDVKNVNGIITLRAYLEITFYDYVIDTKTNKVIRGNKNVTVSNHYILEFVRDERGNNQDIHCPGCGAPINDNVSGVCEYCRSKIVKTPKEFVLSKKNRV